MNRCLSLLMILCMGLWVGCIDSIDIALPEEVDGRLVIEGSVDRTKDKYIFSVFVTRTSAIDKSLERYTEPAKIHLLYQGETILELTNGEAFSIPIHEFHTSYGGQPQGARFKIVVEAEGQQFESTEQQIIDAPAPGEFSTNLISREELNDRESILEREYVELRISTDLRNAAAERVSLLWEVQAYYQFREIIWDDTDFFFDPKICYVFEQDRSSEISLINALNTGKDRISNFKINEKLADYRFNSGHLYQVIQRTLNPNAAEYWEQVAQGIQREGTIFDDPPGRAISNIIGTTDPGAEVLGYFYGAAVDTLFKLAKANETGYQRHLCSQNYLPFSPCCSCLDIRGSSLDRPKNWIE